MTTHLDQEKLEAWMAGELSDTETSAVETHLERCDVCAKQLDDLEDPSESFLSRFRQSNRETLLEGEAESIDFLDDAVRVIRIERSQQFELQSQHSSGTFGRIWLARESSLDREVAYKELRPEHVVSPNMLERFRREAQITAQLAHPGTVPLYDFHEESGRAFYTMRFVRGRTLTELICDYHENRHADEEQPSAEFLKLLRTFVSVCNTIAFAHSRDIIHRDVKGDNILIGDFGEVIVVDWGVAKKLGSEDEITVTGDEVGKDASATVQGQRVGTPLFMAPEQARGELASIGPLADVYGLGALLYELLSGHPPFRGDTVPEVLEAVVNDRPTNPSVWNQDVPKSLEVVCLQALEKDPSHRQTSAQMLGQQVEDWMAEQVQQKRSAKERDRFFRMSQDMLAILDDQHRIREVNPAVEQILGWTREELLTMTALDLAHPDEIDDAKKNRAALVATGKSFHGVERKVRCKDGSYKWMSVNATLIPEKSSIYWVGRDITEYKQLQQRLAGLLEVMPDAVIVTNEVGTVEMVNGETLRLFGYRREELIGCNITKFVAERSREDHRRVLRELVQFRTPNAVDRHLEFYGKRQDGSEFLAEVRHGVLESDYELLFMGSIRDISHRSGREGAS